jgi:hypothetical protein
MDTISSDQTHHQNDRIISAIQREASELSSDESIIVYTPTQRVIIMNHRGEPLGDPSHGYTDGSRIDYLRPVASLDDAENILGQDDGDLSDLEDILNEEYGLYTISDDWEELTGLDNWLFMRVGVIS